MVRTVESQLVKGAFFLFLAVWCTACVPLAGYDQQAYQNATSLKAETLAMMDRSAEDDSLSANQAAVDDLLVQLSAAYEYANGVEHNNEAARNWRDLIGNDGLMIKGWVHLWESNGSISPALLSEMKIQIAEGFDTIICLEANKRQMTSCQNLKRPDKPPGE